MRNKNEPFSNIGPLYSNLSAVIEWADARAADPKDACGLWPVLGWLFVAVLGWLFVVALGWLLSIFAMMT